MQDSEVVPRTRIQALTAVVLTAVVLALAGATLQVAVQMTNALLLERLVFTTRDVVWMAPVSWLAFGLIGALPFCVAALVVPRFDWAAIALGCFGAIVVVLLLVPVEGIATWAAVIVGAGVGSQLAGRAPTHSPRWLSRLGRVAVALTSLIAIAAAGAQAVRSVRGRQAAASRAGGERPPNVLVIVMDVVRASNLSAYGYLRPTSPALERLAAEGVQFDRAYSVAPWTLPSHASMFTGLYPTSLRASYRRGLEDGKTTLAEVLRERGYRTAGFTANETYTGWDARIDRGFSIWRDYSRTLDQVRYAGLPWQTLKVRAIRRARTLRQLWVALRYTPLRAPTNLSFDLKRGNKVTEEFLAWQSSGDADQPFLAFLNYYDAHSPRYSPPEIAALFPAGANRQVDEYDRAVRFIDSEIGQVLDSLRRRGELDRTVLAVVSDHGEMLGEHDFAGHSNYLYRSLLWVPFIVRYPARLPAGAHVRVPVSLRDLGATLLDLASPNDPERDFPGVSLVPLASGTTAPSSPVFAYAHRGENTAPRFPTAHGALYSVVLDSMHYIRHPTEELLFNLERDGVEEHNLIADPSMAAVLARARQLVDSIAGVPR